MILVMGIGFFTTRKILEALGVVDLGIYNVVGSLIMMFDFISSGLSNSTQRYINIGLGKNDLKLTNQYFSHSFFVHVFFALVIAMIAEPVGLWIIHNKLIIPSDRLHAAVIVFHLSIVSLIVRLIKICFESNVIAREQMSIYAYLSLIEGIAKLLICYAIIHNSTFDKLIYYAVLLLTINVVVTLFNMFYCLRKFPESRVRWAFEMGVFKQLLSFVGVNSFGVIAWALGKQGINVVMNMFFGPAINGAKGLASQLDRVITQFGTNVDIAIRPQITKLYAQNEIDEMLSLAMKATKYIYFIMLIIAVPVLFEMENLLSLWLGDVPPYTKVFAQVIIFDVMFSTTGAIFNDVSLATGKIKNIQVYGRMITLAGLPLSYVLLKLSPNPVIPVILCAVLSLAYMLFIVWEMNRHLHFGLWTYCKKALMPILGISFAVFSSCYLLKTVYPLQKTYFESFACGISYTLITIILILLLGVDGRDRAFIFEKIKKKVGI